MRVTLLVLLCLRAVAAQTGTTSSLESNFDSLESNTVLNSISDLVVNTNTEATLITNTDSVTNTDLTPSNTDSDTNTDSTPSNTDPITNIDSTLSDTDPVANIDSTPSNTDPITNTDSTPSNTDPVTNTDSTPSNKDAVKNIDPTPSDSNPVANTDSTASNTDPVANTDSTASNIASVINNGSTPSTIDPVTNTDSAQYNTDPVTNTDSTQFNTDPATNTDSTPSNTDPARNTDSTPLNTDAVKNTDSTPSNPDPVANTDSTPSNTDPVTNTDSTPSNTDPITNIDSTPSNTDPVANVDSTPSNTDPVTNTDSTPSNTDHVTNTDSTPFTIDPVTNTDSTQFNTDPVPNTDSTPSITDPVINTDSTPSNTDSTSSNTADPTSPPLSTTTTNSTSTAPSHPPKCQDPAIYNRTIKTLSSILVGLQNLLNKLQNGTRVTREKRSTPELDGEERNRIDDDGNKWMLTPLFGVNHLRRLLGSVSGTENPSDPDQDSGTSMKPPLESTSSGSEETSLCNSTAPLDDVCHELGTALTATGEVLRRTLENMEQLDASILDKLEQRNAQLPLLIARSDENYRNVDVDKATKKIMSVMQLASESKTRAEEVLTNITSSHGDQSWVFVYALAASVAAAVLLMLGVLVCCCRRRQKSEAGRSPGYVEAHGLPQEVDRFHDRHSCVNDGMSMSTNRSESLSSFQDYRRQTSPDPINSKPGAPIKPEQQNQVSIYPQTRKDPSRDTIHLEVGNNQSYIHVTAALSAISSWRSDRGPDVRDLGRGYPNLPQGTRVQPRSVSRYPRVAALYRDDGSPHLPLPSRYSAWDDGYFPSSRRDSRRQENNTSTGHMGEYGHEPRFSGLSRPIYLEGPSLVGKIPRARC